jgi:hypothetical protein
LTRCPTGPCSAVLSDCAPGELLYRNNIRGYRMDIGGISRFPALTIDFCLLHSTQTGAGPIHPRIHFVSRVISSGAEQPRREVGHSHLVRRLRMHGGVSPFPLVFMAWYLITDRALSL